MIAKVTLISATTLFLLTACGSETSSPAPENIQENEAQIETVTETKPETETAVATPAAFAQCRACHTVEKDGRNGIGPNLWGVAGQPAAHLAGFNYSPAMKESGLTWDTETLDKFLKEPMKTVRGTKMAFAGLRNDEQRAEVIAFLETLKD
ncbi:cytochrome c family protein [Parasphingorhabdus sp.]|uniref:c-type cytochrome n=1 Tax=Parasphingorhabdus sp. TaxID=2709688 RepID=UPI002F925A3E